MIDSRLTPESNAIRRRRLCSACAGRFTTYESAPEHFLFLLMKQHVAKGASLKRPETMIAFMTSVFKGLSQGVEKLVEEVDEIEKVRPKKKRAPVRQKIVVREAKKVKKARRMTAIDEVLNIIKVHRKGVDINKLKNKTGFADSKLRMIVYKAYKQVKIKRIGRGIYVPA